MSEEYGNDFVTLIDEDGNEVEVDFDTGVITNVTKGCTYKAEPFPEFIKDIINKGGLLNSLKK